MKTTSYLILIVITLTYTSCGIFSFKQEKISFNSLQKDGLLIGSITIINEPSDYDSFILRSKNVMSHSSNFFFDLTLNEYIREPDYRDGNQFVYLFAMKRSPGEYHFTNYHKEKDLNEPTSHIVEHKFDISYVIERGEIQYLGNIILYPNRNDNGYFFEIVDDFEKDVLKIKAKYLNVDWDNEIKKAMTTDDEKIEFGN